MRNATESQINDVFDRINTYGHRLSDQERRQAGVQNAFSNSVREISCAIRGDVSDDVLPLSDMPSISVDLPMSKHGYEVKAEEVFWVKQGILRATDLRDSMDEQCVADIISCIVGGSLIPRTKDALDNIYDVKHTESDRILSAIEVYGKDKIEAEFKYCIDQISCICDTSGTKKLRDIIYKNRSTNPFQSLFATIFIAIHELFMKENKVINNHLNLKDSIENIAEKIDQGRSAGTIQERRKNIDMVKGLISSHFIDEVDKKHIYGAHSTIDIESAIRRSEIELAHYELKQGIVSLSAKREIDKVALDKILKTICAIANNGPSHIGKILIGVTDKPSDADRVKILDGVEPSAIGSRYVVGVNREAHALGITVEDYFANLKHAIGNSPLSEQLCKSVLSNIDYNSFHGLGLITIVIPMQQELSYFGDDVYWRDADSTEKAVTAKEVAAIAKRF
ncbi:Divergent AAA domain protein [compost metagenome]